MLRRETTVLIVGGGLSGLLAAHRLGQEGVATLVLDKGKGLGGRLATRRIDDAVFDSGAQYFTVRDETFGTLVESWKEIGLVREWAKGFPTSAGDPPGQQFPRYVAQGGLRNLGKHLAAGLDAIAGTTVQKVQQVQGRWEAWTEEVVYVGKALLLTPPVPQSLELLAAGQVALARETQSALEAIQYDPCLAALVSLSGPSRVPSPGGMFINEGILRFISDNAQKGISPVPAVTLHATGDFSRSHYDHEDAGRLLCEAAEPWLGSEITSLQIHRWRYSQPVKPYPQRCLLSRQPGLVAFAGDAFGEPRVEGASLSGLAAAEALLSAGLAP